VADYLEGQGRFRHLFRPKRNEEVLRAIQEGVDLRWQQLVAKCG
jgi:hypothetical protein